MKQNRELAKQTPFEAEFFERMESLLQSGIEFAKEIAAKKHEALTDEGMVGEMLQIVALMDMTPEMSRDDMANFIIGSAGQLLYRLGLTKVTIN
jgi:hypothetical protein